MVREIPLASLVGVYLSTSQNLSNKLNIVSDVNAQNMYVCSYGHIRVNVA